MWRLQKSALRVHLTLEVERVCDCVGTVSIVVEQILVLQRMLVHPGPWRLPQERVWSGYFLGVWMVVVCWMVKEAMPSLSSSGAVVFVPVSASSSSPPSSGAGVQWLVALSMRPARSHCSLADMLGGTARVMAALRRKRATWISCFHLCWSAFADMWCPLRHAATSAAYSRVRGEQLALRLLGLACCSIGRGTTQVQSRAAPWDSSGGENQQVWIVFL